MFTSMMRSFLVSGAVVALAGCGAVAQVTPVAKQAKPGSDLFVATDGALVITTNDAQQQIQIEVGPVIGQVRVFGISGFSDDPIDGVTSISLTTGRAQDYVEFRVFSEVVPDITVNTGRGHSDVKFIYMLASTSATVATNVVVNGDSAEDKVDFLVESEAAGFISSWTVNGGSSKNEVKATVISPNASDLLDVGLNVAMGDSDDTLDVSITADASLATLNLSGAMGSGEDFAGVSVEQLDQGASDVNLALDMGGSKDDADLKVIGRGGETNASGTVLGGSSDDTLKFTGEGSGALNLTLSGDDGNDYLDIAGKGDVTGTPTLLGGNGNDFLKIVIDGPQIATPLLDGGAGFDSAIGFGTIINCEDVQ